MDKVVIIGGGIVGLFTAYNLLKHSEEYKVTIVDKIISDKYKASIYNAGLITPSFSPSPEIGIFDIVKYIFSKNSPIKISFREFIGNPKWFIKIYRFIKRNVEVVRSLAEASLNMYYELIKRNNIDLDIVNGVVALFKDLEDAEDLYKSIGGKLLYSSDIEYIGYKGFNGGVFIEREIAINPLKLYRYLTEYLSDRVSFIRVNDLNLIKKDGGVEIYINGSKRLEYDYIIISAGSWSRNLCRSIGYDPQILPARGIVKLLKVSNNKIVKHPSLFEDYGIGVSLHKDGILRLTGYFELVGFNISIKRSRMDYLVKLAKKHIKNLENYQVFDYGLGFRPCTPDHLPVIGNIPGYSNIYIASGHCRLGVTLSPITGYIVSSLIKKEKIDIDRKILSAISPNRFK